jgi:hypothetical protein
MWQVGNFMDFHNSTAGPSTSFSPCCEICTATKSAFTKKRVELYPFGWLFAFEEAKAGLEAQPNMA